MTKAEKVAKINRAIESLYEVADDCELIESQRNAVLDAVGIMRLLRCGVETAGPQLVPECLGHESTDGPAGISTFCDGTCRS